MNGPEGIEQVRNSLERCATTLDARDTSARLAALDRVGDGHRVALLGEQPAKAVLINDFLEKDALEPFAALHRERILRFGTEPSLRSGPLAHRLDHIGWRLIDNQAADEPVEVRVDAAVLAEESLTLADLDLLPSSLTSPSSWLKLQSSHSVVMVVDATSVITRTELNLLREIRVRNGPQLVAIFVVGLEDVDYAEREHVVAEIRNRARQFVGAGVDVVVPEPGTGGRLLRRRLAQRGADLRARAGNTRLIVELLLWAEQLLIVCSLRRDALAAGGQSQRSSQDREQLKYQEAAWFEARLAVRQAEGAFADRLGRHLAEATKKFTPTLISSFLAAGDRSAWLRDGFPEQFHAGLLDLAASCETLFAEHIVTTLRYAESQGVRVPDRTHAAGFTFPAHMSAPPATLSDLDDSARWRLLARLAPKTGDWVVGLLNMNGLPVPPVSPIAADLVDFAAWRAATRTADKVKDAIRLQVRTAVDDFAEGALQTARAAHVSLNAELDQQWRAWREATDVEFSMELLRTDLSEVETELEHDVEVLRRLL